MTEMEGSIVDRLWRLEPPWGGKLGDWATFKRYAEAVMDDGCHRPVSIVTDRSPSFDITTHCPPRPMENHGERMIVHQEVTRLASERAMADYQVDDEPRCLADTKTFVEPNITKMFIEHWDKNGAWQTVQRQTYTFVDDSQKIPETNEQRDNAKHCLQDQRAKRFVDEGQTNTFVNETQEESS